MDNLLDECHDILVEYGFTERWAVIEKWHSLGARILKEMDFKPKDVSIVADALDLEEREIWLAILFAKKFPDLSRLIEGKNVSWKMVCEKYLDEK